MCPGIVTVLLLGRPPTPPSTDPSLLPDSDVDRGSIAASVLSPWATMARGFGGRGGGVAVEAWSSAWVRESTLGVEDGRRGGCDKGVDAGRGIWYPLVVCECIFGCTLECVSALRGITTGRRWKSKECFLGWGDGWQRGLPARFWGSEGILASRDWLRGPVMAATVQGAILKPEDDAGGRLLGGREGDAEEEEEEEVAEGGG